MTNSLLVGKIQYDVEYASAYSQGRPRKWDFVREVVGELKPYHIGSDNGWVKIPIVNKKEAVRASTAANSHSRRIAAEKNGWRLQTSVDEQPDCAYLMMRKVWIK